MPNLQSEPDRFPTPSRKASAWRLWHGMHRKIRAPVKVNGFSNIRFA